MALDYHDGMGLKGRARRNAAEGTPPKTVSLKHWIVWIAAAAVLLGIAGYFSLQPRQTRFSLTEVSPSGDLAATSFIVKNESGFDVGDHLLYCDIRAAYSPAALIANSHSKKIQFPGALRNGDSEVVSCLKPVGYTGLSAESRFYCVDVVVHLQYSLDQHREDFSVRRIGMTASNGVIWVPHLLDDAAVCGKKTQ